MKIKKITFPVPLEKISNISNDHIDVFVETDEDYNFTMTVCTPQFYLFYMDKENLSYIPASPPDIIVKELTYKNISESLETYCEDNGYWMKLYFLSGSTQGVFSNDKLDELLQEIKKDNK